MADAAVSFALKNVGKFLIQEGKLLYGVKGQVEEMQTELKWMQCFLKDAEARKRESNLIRNWIFEIREVSYDVEDLIEHFVLKSALRNEKGGNGINRIMDYTSHAGELYQVGSGIEAIRAKLSSLRTSMQTYGIRELRVDGEGAIASATSSRRKRQDYPHVVDHNVIGLDQKIDELAQRLLEFKEEEDCPAASVVCLYGMGGVGKTTTAKKVYTDHRIKTCFDCFAWVYISHQFNPKQVWESILFQLSGIEKKIVRSMSEDELASQLFRLQKEKRCLLVIDDIWRSRDWLALSAAFPYMDRDNKSKILLTTRNEAVASHGVYVYHTSLDILDQRNSLKLLTSTILFLGGPTHPLEDDSNMKKYAEEMVKECAGLPLAITVLGGVLAAKLELREWQRVSDNIRSYLNRGEQEGNDGVTKVLESSYEDLPHHLKTCFLYFSQYPEDEEIKTKELIQRWVGEGFVSSSTGGGGLTTEETAEEYLNELVSRCMIQPGTIGHTGRVKTCRVHDLVRDLCISKAKQEGFAQSVTLDGTLLDKVSSRRVCVFPGNNIDKSILSSLLKISPHLRSLWFRGEFYGEQVQGKVVLSIMKKLKLVRVLELVTGLEDLSIVSNLIHVRFLKLVASPSELSIGNLRCLETLNLESCDSMKIPDSIWGMEQLRHLYLPRYCECESSNQQVGDLPNFQTLVNFPPYKFDLKQNLVKLRSVKKLVIARMPDEMCKISRSQEIVYNRLESLSFMYTRDSIADLEAMTRSNPRLYRLFIEAPITFPPAMWPSNLTKLVLKDAKLDNSHMRALAKMQSLKALFLHEDAFSGKEMIFQEGDFPRLRHLLLESLDIEAWAFHRGALPCLCCLEINSCTELKSIPNGTQFLKELKEIKVRWMPYSFVRRMERGEDDWDMVSHVPSVSYYNCKPAATARPIPFTPIFSWSPPGPIVTRISSTRSPPPSPASTIETETRVAKRSNHCFVL